MDNSTLSNGTTTEALSPADISALYQAYVGVYILFSTITVLVYTTILSLGDEIEYIWLGRFSLPAFLYYLARYPALVSQFLSVLISILPAANTESGCVLLSDVYGAISLLPYIGIQGLLIARAYALYPGNLWVAAGLNLPFFVSLFFGIYVSVAYPGCTVNDDFSSAIKLLNSAQAISAAVTDAAVSLAIIVKVWGAWKLKRISDLRNDEPGIGAMLLSQGLSRFCFVLLMTSTSAILVAVGPGQISADFSYLQETISIILVCQFSLDLRRRNKAHIDTVELPTMSFSAQGARSVLRYVHETFIAEFGEQDLLEDANNNTANGDNVNASTAGDEENGFRFIETRPVQISGES